MIDSLENVEDPIIYWDQSLVFLINAPGNGEEPGIIDLSIIFKF